MNHGIDRREFLTHTALGAVALAWPGSRSHVKASAIDPDGMFVSMPP